MTYSQFIQWISALRLIWAKKEKCNLNKKLFTNISNFIKINYMFYKIDIIII